MLSTSAVTAAGGNVQQAPAPNPAFDATREAMIRAHESAIRAHERMGGAVAGYTAARPSTGMRVFSDAQTQVMQMHNGSLRTRLFFITGSPDLSSVQWLGPSDIKPQDEKMRYKKNRFTLKFADNPEVEADFIARNNEYYHFRMCATVAFTLIGFALGGIYDFYSAEGNKTPYYLLRYLFCGFGLCAIGVAFKMRERVEWITAAILEGCFLLTLVLELWAHPGHGIGFATILIIIYIITMTASVSGITFVKVAVMHIVGFILFELMQLVQPTPEMGTYSFFVTFAFIMNLASCYIQEQYERDNWAHELVLDDEVDKTDALLTGLLPVNVLMQLKQGRQLIADEFEQVTIMLTDIVGFTEIASRVTPSQLVEFLNVLFSIFDKVAEKHGVLKIATIGDAYLCLAGCPEKTPDHAEKIADMALEMLEKVKALVAPDGTQVRVRIGIHTGPVIAGVVGIKMIHYQIWGDSVQIAQQMESSGKASHIHVSENTFKLLEKTFQFDQANIVRVKGQDMDTFYLHGRLKEPHLPTSPLRDSSPNPTHVGGKFYVGSPMSTPRRMELSTSMIFQNASSWTKKPSSPPPAASPNPIRVTSAARSRLPRTPRRSDILAPVTGRNRKHSFLVPIASAKDLENASQPTDSPHSIIDNLLGLNPLYDATETPTASNPLEGADYTDDVYIDDDVLSESSPPNSESYFPTGTSPQYDDLMMTHSTDQLLMEKIDSIVTDVPSSSGDPELAESGGYPRTPQHFVKSLRLTSLVTSPSPPRLPNAPPSPLADTFSSPPQPLPPLPPPALIRSLRVPLSQSGGASSASASSSTAVRENSKPNLRASAKFLQPPMPT